MHISKLLAASLASFTLALPLDTNNETSIISASNLVAKGLMDYYTGNNSGGAPGMFSWPYYWWEAGVAWGSMLEYTYYTDNSTYEALIKSSILFQSGEYWNFMTFNQTSTEGNDDQAFWGITAMAAAEKNFTSPGKGYPDSWAYFAQATFNTMAARWDDTHCGGGLRWQIFTWNAGYEYKNMVSNGCFFHLAARLARFTNNQTFVDWAERIWTWADTSGFMVPINNSTQNASEVQLRVLDGASTLNNCSNVAPYEWSYDQGLMLAGCAFLYNYTGEDIWHDRLEMLWSRAKVFFNQTVMYEAACQPSNRCNQDQRCFKGIFARFMGLTMVLAPDFREDMYPYLVGSANAAARSCSGGTDGHTCGLNWFINGWDGVWGLGEQISALDVFSSLQVFNKRGPYTAKELYPSPQDQNSNQNGTDVYGWGDAGLNSSTVTAQRLDLGTSDKAGAGVLTAVVTLFLIGTSGWLII